MRQENIDKSILQNRIHLTLSERISYYFLSIGLFGFSILFATFCIDTVIKNGFLQFDFNLFVLLTMLSFSLLSYIRVKAKLKLFRIHSSIERKKILEIVNNLFREEDYQIEINEENILKCRAYYSLGLNKIEEVLTILFDNGQLHINIRSTSGDKGVLLDYGIANRHLKELTIGIENACR